MLTEAGQQTASSRPVQTDGEMRAADRSEHEAKAPPVGRANLDDLEVAHAQTMDGVDADATARSTCATLSPPTATRAAGNDRGRPHEASLDAHNAENYHLVKSNTMLGSALRQMLRLDRNVHHYRPPRYLGPNFTYREDDLDLPVDTDFTAAVCVLTSAYNMIDEMQNLLTSMATLNGYQRQLHEGSFAVDVIERAADRIAARRSGVYARYHDPELNGASKKPLSSLASPFHDFAV